MGTSNENVRRDGELCIVATPSSIAQPGNDDYWLLLDTTRSVPIEPAMILPAQAADFIPGENGLRYGHPECWVEGWALGTAQDSTLTFQIMTDRAGTTAAAWTTDPDGPGTAGVVTLSAGVLKKFAWRPRSSHFRIIGKAGATKPDAVSGEVFITYKRGA